MRVEIPMSRFGYILASIDDNNYITGYEDNKII